MFLFRARAEKGIALHNDASSVVANQIARLAAIVVKIYFVFRAASLAREK